MLSFFNRKLISITLFRDEEDGEGEGFGAGLIGFDDDNGGADGGVGVGVAGDADAGGFVLVCLVRAFDGCGDEAGFVAQVADFEGVVVDLAQFDGAFGLGGGEDGVVGGHDDGAAHAPIDGDGDDGFVGAGCHDEDAAGLGSGGGVFGGVDGDDALGWIVGGQEYGAEGAGGHGAVDFGCGPAGAGLDGDFGDALAGPVGGAGADDGRRREEEVAEDVAVEGDGDVEGFAADADAGVDRALEGAEGRIGSEGEPGADGFFAVVVALLVADGYAGLRDVDGEEVDGGAGYAWEKGEFLFEFAAPGRHAPGEAGGGANQQRHGDEDADFDHGDGRGGVVGVDDDGGGAFAFAAGGVVAELEIEGLARGDGGFGREIEGCAGTGGDGAVDDEGRVAFVGDGYGAFGRRGLGDASEVDFSRRDLDDRGRMGGACEEGGEQQGPKAAHGIDGTPWAFGREGAGPACGVRRTRAR